MSDYKSIFNDDEERTIRAIRVDYKIKWLERVFKDFVKEALIEHTKEQMQINDAKNFLMKIADISTRFRVSKQTIHNWINRGIITGNKTGKNRYFTEEEVRNALTKYGHSKYE